MVWVLDSGTHLPPQAGSVLRTSSLPVRCSQMGNGLQTGGVEMASSPARPCGTLVPSVLEAPTGCSALLPAPSWGPCGEAVVSPPSPQHPTLPGHFQVHPGPHRATWLRCRSAGLWTGRSGSSRCGRSPGTCKDAAALSRYPLLPTCLGTASNDKTIGKAQEALGHPNPPSTSLEAWLPPAAFFRAPSFHPA